MIKVIGEVLVDMIAIKENNINDYSFSVGGAPFNVACNLACLENDVYFNGVVGDDNVAQLIFDEIKLHPLLKADLRIDNLHSTTIALYIRNNDDGVYYFTRNNSADYRFKKEDILKINKETKIIHFGSLFLSSKEARHTMFECIKEFKKQGLTISFDINFREDIFKDESNYLDYFSQMIMFSDIVKCTKDEFDLFIKNNKILCGLLLTNNLDKMILITDGENKTICYFKDMVISSEVEKIHPIDTIGAGDSFMAGCLSYLNNKEIENLNEDEIKEMLSFANKCAKLTCLHKGALNAYRSKNDIK